MSATKHLVVDREAQVRRYCDVTLKMSEVGADAQSAFVDQAAPNVMVVYFGGTLHFDQKDTGAVVAALRALADTIDRNVAR